jgi:hypothetical protein
MQALAGKDHLWASRHKFSVSIVDSLHQGQTSVHLVVRREAFFQLLRLVHFRPTAHLAIRQLTLPHRIPGRQQQICW